ncbi:mannitol-1-phosphate 5-dehydrogenase [Humidisolicoccus flavus]|uniref:mannitol-1-phosphate 5-dehydrogenase n=1 Tax=Humidisolicoccus flavus TaxID=3111414 RepID=UPI00324F936F
MKAVHFGAGNIGRGFVALILHRAGYEVVFADVNADLISQLQAADSYTVTEVGQQPATHVVDNYRAINSAEDPDAVAAEIATADIVTCAVGPNVLKFLAPLIRQGIAQREASLGPVAVMACENAINATDTLRDLVLEGNANLAEHAVFANTAVDRIIPAQDAAGIDVTVEDFFEWTIDRTPFHGAEPTIADVHFVDDLTPYIERKLFTVNTGHATIAYHGFVAGETSLAAALENPSVHAEVDAVLSETSAVLIHKFGFDAEEHAAYVATALQRVLNPALPDTPVRVGRQPLRKISRHERFIEPAMQAEAAGLKYEALVRAYGAALHFDVADDEQSVELRSKLAELSPQDFVTEYTGIPAGSTLYNALVLETADAKRSL